MAGPDNRLGYTPAWRCPMIRATTVLVVSLLSAGWAAASPEGSAPAAATEVPRFEGLGPHTRPVRTSSPEAQRFFDQGLSFLFGFNHDEAIRSFRRAAELDPKCAMAWWGIAVANGPHINNPVVAPDRAKAAWVAL